MHQQLQNDPLLILGSSQRVDEEHPSPWFTVHERWRWITITCNIFRRLRHEFFFHGDFFPTVLPDGYSNDDNDSNGECDNASQQRRKYDWQMVCCRCLWGGLKDGNGGGLGDSGSGRQAGPGGRTWQRSWLICRKILTCDMCPERARGKGSYQDRSGTLEIRHYTHSHQLQSAVK